MTIESFEYNFSETDTQVSVKYIENGTENTVLVDIVFVEGILDHAATESTEYYLRYMEKLLLLKFLLLPKNKKRRLTPPPQVQARV